jgi:pseudaminic acid cytidylyltransferase
VRVAVIPARGGSVRIPRKNIREFHGKPIMAYSILAAERSRLFDHIFVSTDSVDVARVAERYGASVIARPAALGADDVGTQEVIRHGADALVA